MAVFCSDWFSFRISASISRVRISESLIAVESLSSTSETLSSTSEILSSVSEIDRPYAHVADTAATTIVRIVAVAVASTSHSLGGSVSRFIPLILVSSGQR